MIVNTSSVSLASSYQYQKKTTVEQASIVTKKDDAAVLELTGNTNEKMAQMKAYEEQKNTQQEQENADMVLLNQSNAAKQVNTTSVKTKEELEYELIQKILELLRGVRHRKLRPIDLDRMADMKLDTTRVSIDLTTQAANVSQPTLWTKSTLTSSFVEESEASVFASTGTVHTADGRNIDFGIQFEMSRSFEQQFESFTQADYILCDPLVINLESDVASVTDEKFLFDLDGDNKEESISFVGKGSGFLALDKNQDGKINDGNELFGTKSQDGFADLKIYDSDQNGWIDEADDVFGKLQIWMKDSEGNDKLLNLKEAGIGAIYLGSADTKFSLNDANNQTNGVIRKTGIYLRESGVAGTVQHLDLTI